MFHFAIDSCRYFNLAGSSRFVISYLPIYFKVSAILIGLQQFIFHGFPIFPIIEIRIHRKNIYSLSRSVDIMGHNMAANIIRQSPLGICDLLEVAALLIPVRMSLSNMMLVSLRHLSFFIYFIDDILKMIAAARYVSSVIRKFIEVSISLCISRGTVNVPTSYYGVIGFLIRSIVCSF